MVFTRHLDVMLTPAVEITWPSHSRCSCSNLLPNVNSHRGDRTYLFQTFHQSPLQNSHASLNKTKNMFERLVIFDLVLSIRYGTDSDVVPLGYISPVSRFPPRCIPAFLWCFVFIVDVLRDAFMPRITQIHNKYILILYHYIEILYLNIFTFMNFWNRII